MIQTPQFPQWHSFNDPSIIERSLSFFNPSFYPMSSKTQLLSVNLTIPSTPTPRSLRPRSPQQPSPGFVFTGSDSRRRITSGLAGVSSRRNTTTTTAPASKKRTRIDSDPSEPDRIISKKTKKVSKSKVSSSYIRTHSSSFIFINLHSSSFIIICLYFIPPKYLGTPKPQPRSPGSS